MPSNLENAIDNLVTALGTLTWLKVIEDKQEPGAGSYTLQVMAGDSLTTHNFGNRKIMQHVALSLFVKASTDVGGISEKLDLINEKIIADRRRGNYAQTTLISDWTVEENEGREGLSMIMDAEVHVYES